MTTRLLLVEDEATLARGLADSFREEGYEVHVIARGDQAACAVRDHRPDVIVLDILLPGRSGLDVLRDLRRSGHRVPVLLLTAKGDVVDRVVGLELGADDYLPKPFALRELLARTRALLRRAGPATSDSPAAISLGGVRFDFRAMTAIGPQGPLDLTPHDILVLKVLAARRGEVVPRVDIVEEVCGLESEATLRKVDNHVMALRRVIGDPPRRPRFIHTVRGEGYRLADDDGD
jgi:two-component system response regulator RegX3